MKNFAFTLAEVFSTHSVGKCKNAFTLAEVLITLGIIGVVAAMTMPMLMQDTRDKQLVAQLKKAYSTMSQALALAIVENGTPNYWLVDNEASSALELQKKMSSYYKVNKDCQLEGGCWPDNNIPKLDGTASGINLGTDTSYATFSVADGALFAFKILDNECNLNAGNISSLKNVCAEIYVDVNGEKHPNIFGYDIFKFYVVKKSIYPAGLDGDTYNSFENDCLNKTSGFGCTAWAVRNSNLDYLHCSDISWGGKLSCKNIFNYNHNTDL